MSHPLQVFPIIGIRTPEKSFLLLLVTSVIINGKWIAQMPKREKIMENEKLRIEPDWGATIRKIEDGYIISYLQDLGGDPNGIPIYRVKEEFCKDMREMFCFLSTFFAVDNPPITEIEEEK